jgi:sugar phosphate isomerase/epimerase
MGRERISISAESTPGWTVYEDFALSRDLGLSRTRLALHKLGDERPDGDEMRFVRSSGLAIDIVYRRLGDVGPLGLSGVDLADPDAAPEARRRITTAVEACVAVGAPDLFVTPGRAHGLSFEEALDAFCALVQPVLPALRSAGVRLVIEPLQPPFAQLGFVHTFRDGVAVARRLGVGIAYDIAHCWWEPALYETLRDNIDLVSVVQLSDLRFDDPRRPYRLVPGDGELPIERVVECVLQAGFEGPFELEVIGPALDEEGAREGITRGVAALERLLTSA